MAKIRVEIEAEVDAALSDIEAFLVDLKQERGVFFRRCDISMHDLLDLKDTSTADPLADAISGLTLRPQTETGISQTETGISQTETGISQTETGISQTETGISQTETGISQTETGISQTETGISQTETGISQSEAPVPTGGVELDSRGLPWDDRIHSKTQSKMKNGEWKLKRNVEPDLVRSVVSELESPADKAASPTPPEVPTAPRLPDESHGTSAVPSAPAFNTLPPKPPAFSSPIPQGVLLRPKTAAEFAVFLMNAMSTVEGKEKIERIVRDKMDGYDTVQAVAASEDEETYGKMMGFYDADTDTL